GEKSHVLSRAVLENEGEAPRGSHARNRRRRERERDPLRKTSKFPVYVLSDELILLFPFLAVLPFLQSDEEECGVARPSKAQKTEPDNTGRRFDAGGLGQHFLDLVRGGFRPLQ